MGVGADDDIGAGAGTDDDIGADPSTTLHEVRVFGRIPSIPFVLTASRTTRDLVNG